MDHRHKVGGYVKLAKLWERSKDAAVAYHSSYYAEKFRDDADKSWWAFTSTLRGIRKSTNAWKWCICSKIAKWFHKSDFLADKGLFCSKYL